jgi:excisionase family DNA binding protein
MATTIDKLSENYPEKWVNIEDVAEHLSLSKDTVRNWMKEGRLPQYKVGKMYKFKLSEIDELVRAGKLAEGDTRG